MIEADVPTIGPGKPIVTGMVPMAIATTANVAYVVGMGALSSLHLSTLEAFARENTAGSAADIARVGDELFVADGRSGVTSYTLDRSGTPKRKANWALPGRCKRIVGSEYGVAVLCAPSKLSILRPGQPPQTMTLPGEPIDAAWFNQSLYVACPGDGLLRVDVSLAKTPLAYHHNHLDRSLSVVLSGSRLFVGLRDKRVLELDPGSAEVQGEIKLSNRPTRLFAGENQLFVASTAEGDTRATWVDISVPGQPRLRGSLPFGVTSAAYVGNARWLIARPEGSLSVIQDGVKVEQHLRGVRFERLAAGSLRSASWIEDLDASWTWGADGSDLSFAEQKLTEAIDCGQALCFIDVTGRVCRQEHEAPTPDCLDIPHQGLSLAWQATTKTLWVIDGDGSAHGLSVAARLREVTIIPRVSTTRPQHYTRFAIDGDRGVAIDTSFGILQIVELGNMPRFRGNFLLHALPQSVAFIQDTAFVVEKNAGLQIVNIAEPDMPREIAWKSFDTELMRVAAKRDGLGRVVLILAEGERGISVWHWDQNRRALDPVGRADTPGVAFDVQFVGDDAFVADGTSVRRFLGSELVP